MTFGCKTGQAVQPTFQCKRSESDDPFLLLDVWYSHQQQRVLLAAAALRNVALIVLDEPTSGLDGYHMRITAQRLQTLAKSGKPILLVTHDIEFINLVATSIVYLQEGAVKYHNAVKR
jgi:energy-coupling factor transport system ATP-binding protein